MEHQTRKQQHVNVPSSAQVWGLSDIGEVSVVIVNWNGALYLERCLTALLEQTLKPHQILLVDNASSDGSLEIVRRFPEVEIIALSRNVGFAEGNNVAIRALSSRSQWVALLNPDAFVDKTWLEQLAKAAQRNPQYHAFASLLLNAAEPTLIDGAGDAYHITGRVRRLDQGVSVLNKDREELEIFSPCAAAALYRLTCVQEIGEFDADYFCYVEDVDLGFRIRLAGYRCLLVPQSKALHVGSGTTGGQHSDFSVYHGHRNLVWTFVKNMPGVLFWPLLPLHVLLNLVSIVWFTFHGKGEVILRAKRDAVLGLPLMWRKRRAIQQSRKVSSLEIWRVLNKKLTRIR